MRNLFVICIMLCSVLSCGVVTQQKQSTRILDYGDSLIASSLFIKEVQTTCQNEILEGCAIDKVSFDYHKNISNKTIYNQKNLALKTKLVTHKKQEQNKPEKILKLEVYIGGEKTDSLDIFESGIYEDILLVERWFYLNKNLELWTLDLSFESEAIEVLAWKKYKINATSGKFMLINSDKFEKSQNVN